MNTTNEKTAFPLYWPDGRNRTAPTDKKWAKFDTQFAKTRDELVREVRRLGGTDMILSTNVPLNRDGLPHANFKTPVDNGVAVYFTRKNKQLCFACDCWTKTTDNLHAIALTIAALRGIARWGTGDMMEAAFRGFAALPERAESSWQDVLGVAINASYEQVKEAHRILVKKHHPDVGGDSEMFRRVQKAWEDFTRNFE